MDNGSDLERNLMRARRVALIGHSGAGKTACVRELGIDCKTADMDEALSLTLSMSEAQALDALDRALNWLASIATPRVVTVRNDEKMLCAMKNAKVQGKYSEQFSCFRFVYLHKPKEEIRKHLGERSDVGAVKYTIENYDRFHSDLYSQLADATVECAGMSVKTVAAEVWDITSHLALFETRPASGNLP